MPSQSKDKFVALKPNSAKLGVEAIYWQDAYVTLANKPYKDKVGLTVTIGCVAEQDKEFLYVSNYYDGIANKWSSPWTIIPRGMVRARKAVSL